MLLFEAAFLSEAAIRRHEDARWPRAIALTRILGKKTGFMIKAAARSSQPGFQPPHRLDDIVFGSSKG